MSQERPLAEKITVHKVGGHQLEVGGFLPSPVVATPMRFRSPKAFIEQEKLVGISAKIPLEYFGPIFGF